MRIKFKICAREGRVQCSMLRIQEFNVQGVQCSMLRVQCSWRLSNSLLHECFGFGELFKHFKLFKPFKPFDPFLNLLPYPLGYSNTSSGVFEAKAVTGKNLFVAAGVQIGKAFAEFNFVAVNGYRAVSAFA